MNINIKKSAAEWLKNKSKGKPYDLQSDSVIWHDKDMLDAHEAGQANIINEELRKTILDDPEKIRKLLITCHSAELIK